MPPHQSWSAPIDDSDPRVEAVARRFCAMAGLDPDGYVRGLDGFGAGLTPRWRAYRLSVSQWLQAADAADPLRCKP